MHSTVTHSQHAPRRGPVHAVSARGLLTPRPTRLALPAPSERERASAREPAAGINTGSRGAVRTRRKPGGSGTDRRVQRPHRRGGRRKRGFGGKKFSSPVALRGAGAGRVRGDTTPLRDIYSTGSPRSTVTGTRRGLGAQRGAAAGRGIWDRARESRGPPARARGRSGLPTRRSPPRRKARHEQASCHADPQSSEIDPASGRGRRPPPRHTSPNRQPGRPASPPPHPAERQPDDH
nr:PREDICTED: uncharacterized protein C11orf96 [Lepisosteus oculatus]